MKNQNDISLNEKIVIKQLTHEDANDLISAGFPFGRGELRQSLSYGLLQAARVIPRATRLVAYHTEDKRAIGFLCLVENTTSLYSIKFVFTDPRFRKMGVATRLFNFAFLLAKERGAKKVHLDVDSMDTPVINFYKKLGFQILGSTLVGQGYLTKLPRLRVIRRTLVGQGYLAKFCVRSKGQLISLQTMSKNSKELLYKIYRGCMDQKWMDFFGLDSNNLINGYLHGWHPFFFRDVLISNAANSFALIFNPPFFSNAMVELYSLSDAGIPSILEELFQFLGNGGMAFAHITLFNYSDVNHPHWFKEKGFKTFQFLSMGRTL